MVHRGIGVHHGGMLPILKEGQWCVMLVFPAIFFYPFSVYIGMTRIFVVNEIQSSVYLPLSDMMICIPPTNHNK